MGRHEILCEWKRNVKKFAIYNYPCITLEESV